MKINKSQQFAIDRIKYHLEDNRGHLAEHPLVMTEFKVTELGAGGRLSVTAQRDITSLPKGNLLRFLDHEYWHFFVGRRGGIEAISYPKSYKQFKGKRAFGFFFPTGY